MKNNDQHHKNLLEVLLNEVPCLEFLLSLQKSSKVSIKKNDYRSVIAITFISDIVSHIVAI